MNKLYVDSSPAASTLPKLLYQRYQQRGEKGVALRQKELGIWREYTWRDCRDKSRSIALGLISLGIEDGDIIAILGYSSPEWFWSELGVQGAGGTVLGLDLSSDTGRVKDLLERFQAKMVFVQDQEQVDRLLEIRSELPLLQNIVYWRDKGLQHYDDPMLISLTALIGMGALAERSRQAEFERRLAEGKETDLAMILPGQMANDEWPATHGLLIRSAKAVLARHPVGERDEYVPCSSPSWFFEQALGFVVSLLAGQRLNFAERADTTPMDFREISPQVVMYPVATWETIGQGIRTNMTGGGRLKKALYNFSLSGGRRYDSAKNGRSTGPRRSILNRALVPLFVRPLRDKHGLNRVRVAYAAGGTLSQEVSRLFCALAIDVEPVFGSSKNGIVASPPPGEIMIV